MENEAIARRRALQDKLRDAVIHSITSPAENGRTVSDPRMAATYVVNMLIVHDTALLAKLAREFAASDLAESI